MKKSNFDKAGPGYLAMRKQRKFSLKNVMKRLGEKVKGLGKSRIGVKKNTPSKTIGAPVISSPSKSVDIPFAHFEKDKLGVIEKKGNEGRGISTPIPIEAPKPTIKTLEVAPIPIATGVRKVIQTAKAASQAPAQLKRITERDSASFVTKAISARNVMRDVKTKGEVASKGAINQYQKSHDYIGMMFKDPSNVTEEDVRRMNAVASARLKGTKINVKKEKKKIKKDAIIPNNRAVAKEGKKKGLFSRKGSKKAQLKKATEVAIKVGGTLHEITQLATEQRNKQRAL